MALNAYISAVQTLLHDTNAQFYPTATLTGFINEARQQIALEGECIRGVGTINTVTNQQLYQNSGVTAPTTPAGISALITPRSISFDNNTGPAPSVNNVVLENRNWDWFNFYWLGILAPFPTFPQAWAPFQIGSPNGSFYIGPKPDGVYQLLIDGVWTPVPLVDDSTAEAIPYPWTDAIQFYALFLAFTDSQRSRDANEAFATYEQFMQRARGIVTPARAEETFPGGLAARRPPGMAPTSSGGGPNR